MLPFTDLLFKNCVKKCSARSKYDVNIFRGFAYKSCAMRTINDIFIIITSVYVKYWQRVMMSLRSTIKAHTPPTPQAQCWVLQGNEWMNVKPAFLYKKGAVTWQGEHFFIRLVFVGLIRGCTIFFKVIIFVQGRNRNSL